MTTAFLYVFLFSSWGLGLLSWMCALANFVADRELDREDKRLNIDHKRSMFSRFGPVPNLNSGRSGSRGAQTNKPSDQIPEKVQELMKYSPNHPEVEEIDGSDQILGVRFEAENYPPGFGDEEE